uniref:Uncharacterized protein n=1 Tax=Romanomermis culicivorax TaxID=13658 RepID=A0A915KSE6_ROMCU
MTKPSPGPTPLSTLTHRRPQPPPALQQPTTTAVWQLQTLTKSIISKSKHATRWTSSAPPPHK